MKSILYTRHRDVEDAHWWFVGRRKIFLDVIREVMRPSPGDLVVDVGCGTGGNVAALTGQYRCLGMDHSELAIDYARRKYPDCEFMLGDTLTGMSEVTDETALYTLTDVLEHIEDDRTFLAQVVAQARRGAHILITVPANPVLWSALDEEAGHFRRYETETLAALWSDLPVDVRFISYFNSRLYPLIWLARALGRWLPLFDGKRGSDLNIPPAPVNCCLSTVFAGETRRITALLNDGGGKPYTKGVSIVALLRRI